MGCLVPMLPGRPSGEHRTRLLGMDEEIRLRNASRPDTWPIWKFAIASMLRAEDMIGLRWSDVDHCTGMIKLRRKGRRPSTRRINGAMQEILVAQRRKHAEYVFTVIESTPELSPAPPPNGPRHPLSKRRCRRFFRADSNRAGLTDIYLDDLHGTGATRLHEAVNDIDAVRTVLRNTTPDTTWIHISRRPGKPGRRREPYIVRAPNREEAMPQFERKPEPRPSPSDGNPTDDGPGDRRRSTMDDSGAGPR